MPADAGLTKFVVEVGGGVGQETLHRCMHMSGN